MTRWQALVVFFFVWAAVYLSSLGSEELRGEEARRILPAQGMLQTGDWVVPRIAGEIYSNKPPLINWIVASSFRLLRSESEWAARLPNVLILLGCGIFVILFLGNRLTYQRALYVALVYITSITMIDKSRMIEIDSPFAAFFGIAWLLWFCWWVEKRSPWILWVVPSIFLGLCFLLKGPVHLFFWYVLVVSVLAAAGSLRDLRHPAHFLGVLLMLGIFLPWMVLNLQQTPSANESVGNWVGELAMRFQFKGVDWVGWALLPFECIVNFFPWIIPLVFAWWKVNSGSNENQNHSRWDIGMRGLKWGIVVSVVAICLSPGGQSRYTIPVYLPASLLLIDLFYQLEGELQSSYERFSERLCRPIGIFVSCGVLIGAIYFCYSETTTLDYLGGGAAFLFGVCSVWLFWRLSKRNSFFVKTALIVGLAVIAYSLWMVPIRIDREKYRTAALEIKTLTSQESGPVIVYIDKNYWVRRTRQLRILYHLPKVRESWGIGVTGEIPEEASYLLYRPEWTPEMGEKLAQVQIENVEKVTVAGVVFALAKLDRE